MSENKFDLKKFTEYKIKASNALKEVLKSDKHGTQVSKKSAEPQENNPKKRTGGLYLFFEILITAAIAFIFALIIHTFMIQTIYIQTSAMEPNLKAGDWVVVNKLNYSMLGYKKPIRGDVIAFEVQKNNSYQIKRVIALSGEKIKIKKGKVYINGKQLKEPYRLMRGAINSEQVQVIRGSYYVLGDNRDNSLDSRSYGAVPKSRIIGPVFMRVWPLNKITTFK